MYVWGDNSEGQLGLGPDESEIDTPQILEAMDEKVIRIACGYHHTALLTGESYLPPPNSVPTFIIGLLIILRLVSNCKFVCQQLVL